MFSKLFMPSISLSQAVDLVGKNSHSAHTAKWYRIAVNNLIGYAGDVRVRSVCVEKIRHWSSSLDNQVSKRTGNPLSPTTKNNYRRAVRGFFNHLADLGYIKESENPVSNFRFASPPRGEPRHLTEFNAKRLLEKSTDDVRNHAIMVTLYATGCRRSELCKMRFSTLVIQELPRNDLEEDETTFIKLAMEAGLTHLIDPSYLFRRRGYVITEGKGRDGRPKTRTILLNDMCCNAICAYLNARPDFSEDYLFLSNIAPSDGRKWGGLEPQSINSIFKKYAALADIHATPHMLRHTLTKRMMDNGAPVRAVQEVLGHSDVSTTMNFYQRFSRDDLFKVLEDYG